MVFFFTTAGRMIKLQNWLQKNKNMKMMMQNEILCIYSAGRDFIFSRWPGDDNTAFIIIA